MITILDEQTINQIAAGEVIENPASVVKELMENALDAGASDIVIETEGGGRGLIRLSDNGHGMQSDHLCLALERHATSKISHVSDLNTLDSLGFRGEALPSIASISKMSLHSSTGKEGARLEVVGGKLGKMQPCARQKGTTIEVRSLFFNVPVRRNFQKSVGSDVAEIHKCLTKIALCHSNLRLRWIHEGKVQFALDHQMPLLARIEVLLGEEFASNLLPVDEMGYISNPAAHRPNRTGHYLAINKRAVVCPFISQKVLEGYSTRLPTHRFPLFVLQLNLPADWIDVNVHPQKREIRLRHQQEIGEKIVTQVEHALERPTRVVQTPSFTFVQEDESVSSVAEEVVVYQPNESTEEPMLMEQEITLMGIFKDYIFIHESDGVHMIHSPSALYRIHYETVTQKKSAVEQQSLLLPLTVEVTPAEVLFLMEHLTELTNLGISIRHFGEQTFLIDAIPACLEFEEITGLIHQLFENQHVEYAKVLTRHPLKRVRSPFEALALIKKLRKCDIPDRTPEGKLITQVITEAELHRRFS